jgi:hypothetical protein
MYHIHASFLLDLHNGRAVSERRSDCARTNLWSQIQIDKMVLPCACFHVAGLRLVRPLKSGLIQYDFNLPILAPVRSSPVLVRLFSCSNRPFIRLKSGTSSDLSGPVPALPPHCPPLRIWKVTLSAVNANQSSENRERPSTISIRRSDYAANRFEIRFQVLRLRPNRLPSIGNVNHSKNN